KAPDSGSGNLQVRVLPPQQSFSAKKDTYLRACVFFFAIVPEKLSPRSYTERLHNLIPNIVRNLASNPKQIYLFVRDKRRTSSQTNEAQRRQEAVYLF
ncbi:MAG: hypothetical protein JZU70_03275, partial [Chlorobium sp.]|nr:hypothetical protein [Chlorobium sp.]